jgi:cytochrome c-type biogenesis protein
VPALGSLIATFVAGLLSFLSPCTAPLLPAYLTVVSGVGAAELSSDEGKSRFRGRLIAGSFFYVLGFTAVFVVIGISAGGIGAEVLRSRRPIEIVGGLLVTALGLVTLGVVKLPWLMRERRFEIPASWRKFGPGIGFPVGIAFGIGWTPCASAYLGAALALAASSGTAFKGGVLLFVFALGIGLPFVLVALIWASLPRIPQAISRWSGPLALVGGVLTVGLGLALATGAYIHVTSFFAQFTTTQ